MKTCKTSYPLWAMSCDWGIEVYPRLAQIGAKSQLVRSTESTPQAFVPKRSARFFLGQDVECWTGPINPMISGGRILWELWDEFLETLETSPVSAPHFFWSSVISPPAGFTNKTETSVGSSSTRVTSRLDLGDIQTFWSTQIAVVYEFL